MLSTSSFNALLKTLEEPPPHVKFLLATTDPQKLPPTVLSRCLQFNLKRLPAAEIAAAARLAAGDLERARLLLAPTGRELRAEAEACLAAVLDDELSGAPWGHLIDRAAAAGEEAEAAAREALEEESQVGMKRSAKDIADGARRAGRRRRTEILDLGLELCALWLRDLAAVAADAEEVVFDRDRLDRLRVQAANVDPAWARAGAEAVQDARRGLALNVSEELALEALFYRLARTLA